MKARAAEWKNVIVMLIVLVTGAVSFETAFARVPQGCCSYDLGGGNCSFDQTPYRRCNPNSEDCASNPNYPYCCDTGGWCGE